MKEMISNKRRLLSIAIPVIVSILSVCAYSMFFRTKIVSVDLLRLIDNYKLKTDLENVHKMEIANYVKITDSLKNNFEIVYKKDAEHPQLQELYNMAQDAENELTAILNSINEENNKKIWTRLNPIIDNYAIEMGYDLVIGANGMGTVLYMKDRVDITDDLIKYINDDYDNK